MTEKRDDIESCEKDDYLQLLESVKRHMDPASDTVLLVDDEKGIRMKVAREVKAFAPSVVVFEATNGAEALETLNLIRTKYERDPLLIVLDLHMPVMDGWEVIKRLKRNMRAEGKMPEFPSLRFHQQAVREAVCWAKRVFMKASPVTPRL